jgi:hypothetical protein
MPLKSTFFVISSLLPFLQKRVVGQFLIKKLLIPLTFFRFTVCVMLPSNGYTASTFWITELLPVFCLDCSLLSKRLKTPKLKTEALRKVGKYLSVNNA